MKYLKVGKRRLKLLPGVVVPDGRIDSKRHTFVFENGKLHTNIELWRVNWGYMTDLDEDIELIKEYGYKIGDNGLLPCRELLKSIDNRYFECDGYYISTKRPVPCTDSIEEKLRFTMHERSFKRDTFSLKTDDFLKNFSPERIIEVFDEVVKEYDRDYFDEIALLKKRIEELETHIKYSPDGEGYYEAKIDFESRT